MNSNGLSNLTLMILIMSMPTALVIMESKTRLTLHYD